jgi:hypothetical protein
MGPSLSRGAGEGLFSLQFVEHLVDAGDRRVLGIEVV